MDDDKEFDIHTKIEKIGDGHMTYQTAMEHIADIGKTGSILGLAAVKELLDRLGNPQDQLQVIHVAGTNGKGSICTFLESMYRAEGKRVGRYISPTLYGYLERFQINGVWMTEDVFAELFDMVYPVLLKMREDAVAIPTVFEVETVIAFLYFVREHVDIVILETGMGGREDATNVVTRPVCTVFASIGMDHMQFLGDTIGKIAYQKAGIIKQECPVVSYPNVPEVCSVLETEWEQCNKNMTERPEFCVVKRQDVSGISETIEGSRFRYKGEEYRISLPGSYQIYNAVTAIETKLLLDGNVNKEALMNVKWPARFECVCTRPLLIRDGAHNVDGVKALRESIEKHFTNRRLIFIIGILKDKEYEKMVAILCPMAECVFTITPPTERGLPGAVLRDAILPYCKEVSDCESVKDAVERAEHKWNQYNEEGMPAVIIAWGSLSYMGLIGRN